MRNVGKIMVSVALVAGLTACANSEKDSSQPPTSQSFPVSTSAPVSESTEPSAPGSESATNAPAGDECTADDIKVEGAAGAKPSVTIPTTCKPPTKLVVKDLIAGEGPEAAKGNTVTVQYLLVTWSTKQEKDSSWKRNQPFPLENLGEAGVIDGWNEGLIGIKKGARRLLIVPPEKGYGAGGNGIAPNETLVFVVDAESVTAA